MKHDMLVEPGLSYASCRYGTSRLLFRGPRRPLDGRHLAFVGGTETFGKFLAAPYPALVETLLGETCINFGQVNASVDAFSQDPMVGIACRDAVLTILEVTGAHNMSNRFYTVHPRRNDRFVRASSVLRAIYPEVDFADFCFTRHLLTHLHDLSAKRFAVVREELQLAWLARMRMFLEVIGTRTLLLWFSANLPSDIPWDERPDPLGRDPLFVTRQMLDTLRPLVRGVAVVQPSVRAQAGRGDGLLHGPGEEAAAAGLMGAGAHREAARALVALIRTNLT